MGSADLGAIMRVADTVFITSRAFALYFLCWALDNATYLPSRVLELIHHAQQRSLLVSGNYLLSYDKLSTVFLVLRVVTLLCTSMIFYRSGPGIQGFFTPTSNSESAQ